MREREKKADMLEIIKDGFEQAELNPKPAWSRLGIIGDRSWPDIFATSPRSLKVVEKTVRFFHCSTFQTVKLLLQNFGNFFFISEHGYGVFFPGRCRAGAASNTVSSPSKFGPLSGQNLPVSSAVKTTENWFGFNFFSFHRH